MSSADLEDGGPLLSQDESTSVLTLTRGGGRVLLSTPGRLVATAAVMLGNTGDIGSSSIASCDMVAAPGEMLLGTPHAAWNDAMTQQSNVSLVGSAAVPAGSYDVELRCRELDSQGGGRARAISASLVVQAVPD
mgnify:CR=1 FL=1